MFLIRLGLHLNNANFVSEFWLLFENLSNSIKRESGEIPELYPQL
jgi:hypothetical protein